MKAEKEKKITTGQLAQCALVAALAYIGFQFLRVDIPVGTVKTAIHMGNVFVVMGTLLLGFKGGMAGALGLTLADLTSGYVAYAPETFILKLIMGTITWLVASAIRKKEEKNAAEALPEGGSTSEGADHTDADTKGKNAADASLPDAEGEKKGLKQWMKKNGEQGKIALISSAASLGANVILDPLFGYFYQKYIFGIPQDISSALAKIASLTTLFNTVVSVILVTVLWPVLHKALTKSGLI